MARVQGASEPATPANDAFGNARARLARERETGRKWLPRRDLNPD